MVIHPNKPIMFAVDHFEGSVEGAMEKFAATIKGKKRLFIELFPSHVQSAINGLEILPRNWEIESYVILVKKAKEMGLEIIGLDKKTSSIEFINRYSNASAKCETESKAERIRAQMIYSRREKEWLAHLEGTGKNDVIVMHPGHARAIIRKMRIPKSNIAFMEKRVIFRESLRIRALSNIEARKIEKDRTERRARSARQRFARSQAGKMRK